jgi:uroporphyrinogen-III decarboxylase
MPKNPTAIKYESTAALRAKIEKTTGKTPEQLYAEREKRVRDAIELKEPDRVPVWMVPDPVRFAGLKRSVEFYDPRAWQNAIKMATLEFEPDLCLPGFGSSGLAWETLGIKNRLWPGGPLPDDYEYQFIETEFLKEDEYDLYLSDPSDFVIRYYLPRIYGNLAPLSKLPKLSSMFGGFEGSLSLITSPEFKQLARTFSKAAKESSRYRKISGDVQEEFALLGFPAFSYPGGVGGAPFDTVSSFLRGMKGSMLDMYRRPEKLLQLCDMLLDQRIKAALPADPNTRGNPKRLGIPLWRGDKAFMSDQQFKKFYWPGLKKALAASIELGYVPMPFFEDHFGNRLEHLLELPKGKIAALVDHSDVVRAKEILKGHTCVIGTAPASIRYGSLQNAADYFKNLIKQCAKGGGFMLNLSFPDKGTTADLKAMINSIKIAARY